ncbi:hypothetical protein [Pleionea litopenaei]|uniref:Uncharacterized protein n=1 Tax=Pleionea litopenaei TaxID=3070815 RepID=A0AA51RUB1_9GAMM|nr:hypothetical protein [Pleionea sp. HL-JVS1]WMS87628.1 hypothetical protein Q9312_01580 [Pleionea sp. HL-JVS1]
MHINILKRSIDFLVDDGRYDRRELETLLAMALEDKSIDDDEKRVLSDIFNTAAIAGLDQATEAWIKKTRAKYAI